MSGELRLEELLTDYFLFELHRRLYGDIWEWAGKRRQYFYNIGIDTPYDIPAEVHSAIGTIRFRWEHTNDWTPKELGIAVHAELVRIHPFADGNGRSTRLLADLIFAAAQDDPDVELYDWHIDKPQYIALLRAYDHHRDSRELAAFIPTYTL